MYPGIWRRRDQSSYGYPYNQHIELQIVTPPTDEPVSLHHVKLQTRIPYNDADELLTLYITAARDRIERYMRRSLMTQTRDIVFDYGPAWVELPYPPIQSVVGVYTTGLDNVETVVDPSIYFVNPQTRLVSLNIGAVWPLHRGSAGWRVRYIAGYGTKPTDVPASIRKEILSLVAQFDDVRETIDLPTTTQAMLRPYRVEGGIRYSRSMTREDVMA